MKKGRGLIWGVLVFILHAGAALGGQDPIEGYWEGAIVRDNAVRVIRIEFAKDGRGYKGYIQTPDLVSFTLHPVAVTYEPPKVTFRLPLTGRPGLQGHAATVGEATMTLDDQIGEMRGTVGEFSPAITIHLKRSVKPLEAPTRTEEIKIPNAEITLAGALIKPATPGPHPAIVWIHGAITNLRKESELTTLLARRGIASLVYDKRGSGKSSGDLGKATIDEHTSDALAVVRFLSKRRDIDRTQIGLHGDSGGAWAAWMVARRSENPIAFIITTSGPAESPADYLFHLAARLFLRPLESKTTPEEMATAEEYLRLRISTLSSGEGREEYQAFMTRNGASFAKTKDTEVGRFLRDWEERPTLPNYLRCHDCNPVPYLKKSRIPFLAFYGTKDRQILAEETAKNLEGYLTEAMNRDFKIVMIPGADHELTLGDLPMRNSMQSAWERISPDYIDALFDWLQSHVRLATPRPHHRRAPSSRSH